MFLQLLQRNADYYPTGSAISYANAKISHLELLERVEGFARGLLNCGVTPGSKVAIYMENCPEFLVTFFAVAACRGVNVSLNIDFKADELAFFLKDSEAMVIVTDAARVNLAAKVAASVSPDLRVIVVGGSAEGALDFSSLVLADSGARLPSARLDDDLVYIYSSGSTGRPKCAPRTVEQYWWEMDDVIECLQLSRKDKIFCTIPLFHNFGAVQCMLTSIGSGAELILLDKSNPFVLRRSYALKLIERERPTIFPCVPFILEHLADATTVADLSSIRVCYSAAAALTRSVAEKFFHKFHIPIREHYGCTEVGAMTINLEKDPPIYGDSVGTAFPGVRIRILDDDGAEVPAGQTGEIVVSARQMTRGYMGMDDLNSEFFRCGNFYTGDLGKLDAEGRLYLQGRKKFVIDVVGQKVSPVEVEDVLNEHPAVAEAIVIGVPNPAGDAQVIHAFIVAQKACSKDELIAFSRKRLANFKVPRYVSFISSVPKDGLGKPQRKLAEIETLIVEKSRAIEEGAA